MSLTPWSTIFAWFFHIFSASSSLVMSKNTLQPNHHFTSFSNKQAHRSLATQLDFKAFPSSLTTFPPPSRFTLWQLLHGRLWYWRPGGGSAIVREAKLGVWRKESPTFNGFQKELLMEEILTTWDVQSRLNNGIYGRFSISTGSRISSINRISFSRGSFSGDPC